MVYQMLLFSPAPITFVVLFHTETMSFHSAEHWDPFPKPINFKNAIQANWHRARIGRDRGCALCSGQHARSLARVADGGWLGAALAEQLEG